MPPAADTALTEARDRAAAAAARLLAAEAADPAGPGWEAEYEAAAAAARATSRRLEALEQARAATVERAGKRAATAKAAQKDLSGMAAGLAASRDQLAAAAAEHLRVLAGLVAAAAEHNARLAEARAAISAKGLRVRDDDGEGDHAEGVLDAGGLRAGGTDWLPVDAGGLTAHAVRQVFSGYGPGHPLADVGRYRWRPHEVERRADGLQVPVLADTGASLPPVPQRARAVPAEHEFIPPVLAPHGGIYRD